MSKVTGATRSARSLAWVMISKKPGILQEKTVGPFSDSHHQAKKVLHMAPHGSVKCLSTLTIS